MLTYFNMLKQAAEEAARQAAEDREAAEAEVERLKDVASSVQQKVQATADIVSKMSANLEQAQVRYLHKQQHIY